MKMKRVLACVLSIVLSVNTFSTSAFAAEGVEDTSTESVSVMDGNFDEGEGDLDDEFGLEEVSESEEQENVVIESGSCGPNATYQILEEDTGYTLVVSGSGDIVDFWVFSESGYAISSIIIEEGITSIPASAFNCFTKLTDVNLPDSLTSIGPYAFSLCEKLSTIVIPKNVKSIGEFAFHNCAQLKNAMIYGDVEIIDSFTFSNCSNLKMISLPEGITKISEYAFSGCDQLDEVYYSGSEEKWAEIQIEGANEILENAVIVFEKENENTDKESIIASGSCGPKVTYKVVAEDIGYTLIISGSGEIINKPTWEVEKNLINKVVIEEGITSIGTSAFSQFDALTNVSFPSSLIIIGQQAFFSCDSLGESLIIPNNVTLVGQQAFSECGNLQQVIMESNDNISIKAQIDLGAFYNCKSLKSVELSHNVYDIRSGAFANCSKLENITIPAAVDHIGVTLSPFSGCKILTINCPKKSYAHMYACENGIPCNITDDFENSEPETITGFSVNINEGVITLSWDQTYETCRIYKKSENDDEYNILSTINDISSQQYTDADIISGIEYYYYIVPVNKYGKEGETSQIVNVVAPDLKTILTGSCGTNISFSLYANGELLLSGYGQMKNYMTSALFGNKDSLVPWTDYKTKIKSVFIEEGITSLSNNAFYKCTNLREITIPESVITISSTAFSGCSDYTFNCLENSYAHVYALNHNIPCVFTGSLPKPEPISSFVAIGDTDSIVLNWSRAAELSISKYRIYKKVEGSEEYSVLTTISDASTLSFTDTDVTLDSKYTYYIVAVNDIGVESVPSEIVTVSPEKDTEAPAVTTLNPVNGSLISGVTSITAHATDNISVVKTELWISTDNGKNWSVLQSSDNSSCNYSLDTNNYSDGKILIKGMACDGAGNESTGLTYEYRIDNTGPEKVTGLSYESTATTATIKWNDVADQDFSYFRLERKNPDESYSQVQDITKTLGVNLSNLIPESSYTYRVVAYDKLGNRGEESEEITVTTAADTTAPVITSIKPDAGYYKDTIPLSFTSKDDASIKKVVIQTSDNAVVWNDFKVFDYDGTARVVTTKESLDLSSWNEGELYIRAIATDSKGNQSDISSKAPYVQYIVDKTAPAAPTNVELSSDTGCLEVTWDMGAESDLADYTLYRSEDGTNFTVLKSGLYSINYYDRDVSKDQTYWYRLSVKDYAGNSSDFSQMVSGQIPEDTEAPEIVSVSPENGSIIGPSASIVSAVVRDNWKVSTASLSYTVNDEDTVYPFVNAYNINTYYKTISGSLNLDDFEDGDRLHLKVSVTDAQGLTTEEDGYTYIVDKSAPAVERLEITPDSESVVIDWNGFNESDLAGYRIYRKVLNGNYSLIAQRTATGTTAYSYKDVNAAPKVKYYYKVEAIDKVGNCSFVESKDAILLDTGAEVHASLVCDLDMQVNTEYKFDASESTTTDPIEFYSFDFGDGTSEQKTSPSAIHRYTSVGTYTATLTVTDTNGLADTITKTIVVSEPQLLGTLNVKLVDTDGKPIFGIPVYLDIDNTSENMKYSDVSGEVAFVAKSSKYSVGAYADGYLPSKKYAVVKAGAKQVLTITMIKEPIVTGNFEVSRLTLDEIVAAGIDIHEPANQQVVKVTVHLTYSTSSGQKNTTMNILTNGSTVYSGGTTIIDTDEGKRQVTANVISVDKKTGNSGTQSSEKDVIVALLDIPVEASYLKEFFDVKLHIINNADTEFVLSNNEVTLNVPDGMSLPDLNGMYQFNSCRFDQLRGQQEETVSWTLRGDVSGTYDLTADYSAILEKFNTSVNATFKTDAPITVYGNQAMKLVIDANSQIDRNAFYFDISMVNITDADIYMPSFDVVNSYITAFRNKNIKNPSEDLDFEEHQIDVRFLNSYYMNTSGYKNYLSNEIPVSSLESGARYTKQYVAYNTTDYDTISFIKEAATEIENEYGITVEVNYCNKDIYSIENASQKVNAICRDQEKISNVLKIIDIKNQYFYYFAQAIEDDGSFLKKLGEAFYISTDAVLNLDFDGITWENTRKITRNYFYQLIQDDAFQSVVKTRVDDHYIKIAQYLLGSLAPLLSDYTEKSELDVIAGVLKETSSQSKLVNQIAVKLRLDGMDGFVGEVSTILMNGGVSAVSINALRNMYMNDKLSGTGICALFGNEVGKAFSDASTFLKDCSTLINDFNYSAKLTEEYLTIAAAHDASLVLCDLILEGDGRINQVIIDEIKDIKKGLEEGFRSQQAIFVKEFSSSLTEILIREEVDCALACMDAIFTTGSMAGGGIVYKTLRYAFNIVDQAFQLDERVSELELLRVAGSLTLILRSTTINSMNSSTEEEAIKFLESLKYLIKMRLIGEEVYVNIAKDWISHNKVLACINENNYTGINTFKSIEEYYESLEDAMLYDRDSLYNDLYYDLFIPDAPEVTIDYENQSTFEKFGSEYEYSYNGQNWSNCSGDVIAIIPKNSGQTLWVRVAESATNKAGNISKVSILSKKNITDTISVSCYGKTYYLDGLSSGKYGYLLTNNYYDDTNTAAYVTFESDGKNQITIETQEEYKYIKLVKKAFNYSISDLNYGFESNIRTIGVEQKEVDQTTPFIINQSGNFNADLNDTVQLTVDAINVSGYWWYASSDNGETWFKLWWSGCKTNTLNVTMNAVNMNRQYKCILSGNDGTETETEPVHLNKIADVVSPDSFSAEIGDTLEFTVSAKNVIAYQWLYSTDNGETWSNAYWPGKNSDTMSLTVDSNNKCSFWYRCKLTGYDNSVVFTDPAHVVDSMITKQSTASNANIGEDVEFSVTASNATSYKWYYSLDEGLTWRSVYFAKKVDGITTANTNKLVVPLTTAKFMNYPYRCEITCMNGDVLYSDPVRMNPLEITSQPQNINAELGDLVTFTVETNSASKYTWEYSTDNGQTWKWTYFGTGYDTNSMQVLLEKEVYMKYLYRCTVLGPDGKPAYTDVAGILVDGVNISSQPQNVIGRVGEAVTFHVDAERAKTFSWEYSADNGATWKGVYFGSGAASDTYTFTVTSPTLKKYLYRCKVTGYDDSSLITNTVRVENVPVTIVNQTDIICASLGDTVQLFVNADYASRYKWYYSADGGSTWKGVYFVADSSSATIELALKKAAYFDYLYRCDVIGVEGDIVSSIPIQISSK